MLEALQEEEEEERERIEKEKKREEDLRNGLVHGDRYMAYSEAEIRSITDINFLRDMRMGIIPSGQPTSQWEHDDLNHTLCVISECIKKLEK